MLRNFIYNLFEFDIPLNNVGIGTYGYFLAIIIYIIGVLAFIFQSFIIGSPQTSSQTNTRDIRIGGNLIMIIISQELILLSIGILLINISVGLDDMVGSNLTLYLLPLAGAESSVALALQVAYYPLRGTISFR